MNIPEFDYPLDPTGTAASNLISDQRHTITPISGTSLGIVFPRNAAYFGEGLVVKRVSNGATLVEGTHYTKTHRFRELSEQYPYKDLFYSITIIDPTITGQLDLTYQTIGERYTFNQAAIVTMLANTTSDPRTIDWEDVANRPVLYTPAEHLQDVSDVTQLGDVVAAINRLTHAISQSDSITAGALNQHVEVPGNAHNMTLADLGIARLASVYKATEATGPTNDEYFVSPLYLQRVIDALTLTIIASHANATGNVHGLTPDDIDLGNVNNWPVATLADLESGNPNAYLNIPMVQALIAAAVTDNGTTTTVQKNRLAKVDNNGLMPIGDIVAMYHTSTEGVVTRRGGVSADASGVGFTNAAGARTAFVDSNGKLQLPNGFNSTSDISLKEDFTYWGTNKPFDPSSVKLRTPSDLELCKWRWKASDKIAKELHGTVGAGYIANHVQKIFPECVTRRDDGLLSLDYTLLAAALTEWYRKPMLYRLYRKFIARLFK